MKINQVEELVGITKKNIRFYEEQGLLTPQRNPENGYREYTLQDVENLNKIKLLRSLDVPIEKIRQIQQGELSFDACMEDHSIHLSHRQHELERMKEICQRLSEEVDSFHEIEPSHYFGEMKKMEEGGIHFMDTNQTDVKKPSATAPIIITIIVVSLCLSVLGVLIWVNTMEAIPIAFILYFAVITIGTVVGIVIALQQRMKEIEGGELDEARKY